MRGVGNLQALVIGAVAIFSLVTLPFIWLFDQLGGPLFIIVVFGIPVAIWWLRKHGVSANTGLVAETLKRVTGHPEKPETSKQKATRKKEAAEEFNTHNKRVFRERQNEREYFLRKHEEKAKRKGEPGKSRVNYIVEDGEEMFVDWQRQFEEIGFAWRQGDYAFARDWLQKLAYRLKSEDVPETVHTKFKALMTEFTRDDPLYAEVMNVALPVIAEQPGIIQSLLSKQFPQFDAEQFRYAMYYGEVIGDVLREKKGRSYALKVPPTAKAAPVESMKDMGTEAILRERHNHWIERRQQMLGLIHLRPFWQLVGHCAGKEIERKTLFANDPFWDGNTVPWNCSAEQCDCRVDCLSRIELKRYVEGGCAKGDESAADLPVSHT